LRGIAQTSAHDVTGALQFNPVFAQAEYKSESPLDLVSCIWLKKPRNKLPSYGAFGDGGSLWQIASNFKMFGIQTQSW
jgi:hypothetical protein